MGGGNAPPVLTCVDEPQRFTYVYASDKDRVGKPVESSDQQ